LRKSILILCAILIIGVVGLGCLPTKPAVATVSAKDTEQDSEISKIKSSITSLDEGKASKSAINDINDRISKINQGTAPDLSGYYKRVEVDTAISTAVNNAITALKNEKPWNTSGGGITPSESGGVTWLTNPSNVQVLGSSQVCFTMKVQNTTSTWVYVRPIINVNLHTGQSPLSTALDGSSLALTIGGNAGNYIDSDFSATGTTSSVVLIPTHLNGAGSGEIQISANSTIDLLVCIQLNSSVDARIWDIVGSVNWRSL